MPSEMFDETPEEIDFRMTGERLAAMVDAEATAAEAETPEDEDEEGAEDEEDATLTAMQEALGNYLTAVMAILGESAEIKPCVFCQGWGFNSLDVLPDPHSHRCETCGGIGRVYTGSLVKENETRRCEDCGGQGFQATNPVVAGTPAVEGAPAFQVLTPAEVERIAADARANAAVNTG